MQKRTFDVIATQPSNDAGAYYFISLRTGRRINRRSWTPLPMPESVVDQIHRIARRAKASKKLTFTNVNDVDLDELYAADADDTEVDNIDDNSTGVDDDDSDDDDPKYNPDSNNYYSALDDDDDNDGNEDDDDDKDTETPGVENEDDNGETPGVVDNDENESGETPGVGENNETPGVNENIEIPGVEDYHDVAESNSQNDNNASQTNTNTNVEEDKEIQRTAGTMNLQRQNRKTYNLKELEKANNEQVLMLQFQSDDFDVVETDFDQDEAEYIFPH